MNDTDQAFFDLADATLLGEANNLLDKQLASMVAWREEMEREGKPHGYRALHAQIRDELARDPRRIGPVLFAFSAALERLLEKGGRP